MIGMVASAGLDELAVRADLESVRFRSGEDSGRWRLVAFDWPVGVFAVSAARRPDAPDEYGLRIDFLGYPRRAPTATPWSIDRGEQLTADERPKGGRAGSVFLLSDWDNGRSLYAPWDRVVLERAGHPGWADHPMAWNRNRDVTYFLNRVHELLHADDYEGI